jgi:hypothetical protein
MARVCIVREPQETKESVAGGEEPQETNQSNQTSLNPRTPGGESEPYAT